MNGKPATGKPPVTPLDREALTREQAEELLVHMSKAFPSAADLLRLGHLFVAGPRAEEARLGPAEARYRALVEQIPAVTFMAPLDGSKSELYVSPQIEALLGFSAQEWLDDPFLWHRQLHPDDRDEWTARFAHTCFSGETFRADYRILARDGRVVWVHGEARVLRDETGQPLFLQGVAFDITERREAQEALQRAHDELELRVRERTEALAGVNEALQVQITKQRRLEEELRQAQKMEAVGRLAGGVAHDFNNLLTVITGYSEIVLGSLYESDPLREAVGEIQKAGERAAALTRQLLAFGRKQLLMPRVLNLGTLVADMQRMLPRLIGEHIELTTDLQADLWSVRADPGQIEQVILNLAINARDAMPGGGQLTIATGNVMLATPPDPALRPGPYVLLAVRDTGCGMSDEVKARIFEPFFTTKEVGQGTGLGLATVYGIVKQSGGQITVTSAPGRGTAFTVYLPRVAETAAKSAFKLGLADSPGGSETVLLVEDEPGVRSMAGQVLRALGYQVLEAGHGAEALAVSERHDGRIDLLVTDVVMPGMGGRALADRLKQARPEMEVLFVSGYTDDDVVRRGVQNTEAAVLQKPFAPQALARRAREVLDTGRGAAVGQGR